MTWATPKTDWDTDDVIATTDLNRIEGNTAELRANVKRVGTATIENGLVWVEVTDTTVTASTKILFSIVGGTSGLGTIVRATLSDGEGILFDRSVSSGTTIIDYFLIEP